VEFIAHRVNTIYELKKTPKEYGIEVDLRDFGDRLILQHDPFTDGEDLDKFLKFYDHGKLILNIKSERIEYRVLEILKKFKIRNYFFLDSSFPMIYELSNNLEKNIAIRFSEFESIETVISMSNMVDWVWVDCFTRLHITSENFKVLKELGFKLCLVSPELQNQSEKIETYQKYLMRNEIVFDAVCTKIKYMESWKNNFR
jgi:hypothetical protein